MRILLTLLFVFSSSAFADVSRDEAKAMIDEMVKSNMISAVEAEKAKARLVNMNSHEWAALNKDAEVKASRMPASVPSEGSAKDLGHEQLSAIESDLKMIAPEMDTSQVSGT